MLMLAIYFQFQLIFHGSATQLRNNIMHWPQLMDGLLNLLQDIYNLTLKQIVQLRAF